MISTLRRLSRAALALLGCVSCAVVGATDTVRPSALAGTWYPGDATGLAAYVDGLLDAAKAKPPEGTVRAIIVPHAGYRFSGATAAEVVALVRGRSFERVLVLAPSHRSGFHGLSVADATAYETPLGEIPLDAEALAALRASELVRAEAGAHDREHSIEIELPLLQRALAPGWRLVPVLVGQMDGSDYREAADLLRPLADDKTLVVVSSDFTHYGPRFGYMPFPPDKEVADHLRALDDGAVEQILDKDAARLLAYQAETGITMCGYRPVALLLDLLPADAKVERVAYATSGELTGDWMNSVSYVGLVVTGPTPICGPAPPSGAGKTGDLDLGLLHRLAVLGVEDAVLGPSEGRAEELRASVDALPDRLREPAGAFVTLKRGGQLRGCIGYILPKKPIYQAVLENGVNAARNDRRFWPVAPEELSDLEIEVSVLSPPEPIPSYEQFRVGEQGIILSKDDRQAVFLPEVAVEQGWSRDETLTHLAQKAGLPQDAWREGAQFMVFTSTKYTAPYARPSSIPEPEHAAAQ